MMIQILNYIKHLLNLGKEKDSLKIKRIQIFKAINQFFRKIIVKFNLYLKANLKMFLVLFHKYFL